MPIEVEVPDQGIVEFPDGMSQVDIRDVLRRKFPPQFQDLSAGQPLTLRQPRVPGPSTTAGGPRVPLASYAETIAEPSEELTRPRIQAPEATITEQDSPLSVIGKEAWNIAKGVPEFFTSTAGLMGVVGGAAAPTATTALFSGQMFSDLGQQIMSNYRNWGSMSRNQKIKAVVDMVGTGALGGLLAKHTTTGVLDATVPARALAKEIRTSPMGLPVVEPESAKGPVAAQIQEAMRPVPPAGMVTLQSLRPAVKTMEGEVVAGEKGQSHNDIIEQNKIPAKEVDRREFVDTATGQEVSREKLAEAIPTKKEGEAHSSDLAKAQEVTPPPPTPAPVKAEPSSGAWKGTVSFETYDEPTGKWEPQNRPIVISKSTIPGDKPWRATVFAGGEDMPVAIGHVQLDTPELTKQAMSELSEQLGRYTRKLDVQKGEPQVKAEPSAPPPPSGISPTDKGITKEEKAFRATSQGQRAMASRAARIGTLHTMNEAIRKIDPNEAFDRKLIETLPDSQIDAWQEDLRKSWNKLLAERGKPTPTSAPSPTEAAPPPPAQPKGETAVSEKSASKFPITVKSDVVKPLMRYGTEYTDTPTLSVRRGMKLIDVIDAPELFAKYPQIADYKIVPVKDFDSYSGIRHKLKTIYLVTDTDGHTQVKHLWHEITHAIQEAEGRPSGRIASEKGYREDTSEVEARASAAAAKEAWQNARAEYLKRTGQAPPTPPAAEPSGAKVQAEPAQAKFRMTFDQFLNAPREGELLEGLRKLPRDEPTPEQVAKKERLDRASEALEKAGLTWIYDRNKQTEAAMRRLPKSKSKLVKEYDDALNAWSQRTPEERVAGQRKLYDKAVASGLIEPPPAAEPSGEQSGVWRINTRRALNEGYENASLEPITTVDVETISPSGEHGYAGPKLIQHIKEGNPIPPVVLEKYPDGTIHIVDGSNRINASIKAGVKTIKAQFVKYADEPTPPAAEPPVAKVQAEVQPPAKEPWQMTQQELRTALFKLQKSQPANLHYEAPFPEWQLTLNQYVELGKWQGRSSSMNEGKHYDAVKQALSEGKPVPPEVLADYPDLQPQVKAEPSAPPPPAQPKGETAPVAKVTKEVQKVARTEGQRSAKEIKSELVDSLEQAIAKAPSEMGLSPSELEQVTKVKKWIHIPGDGDFNVVNSKEALGEVLKRAKKISISTERTGKVPMAAEGKVDPEQLVEQAKKIYGSPEDSIKHLQSQLESGQEIDHKTRFSTERAIELLREETTEFKRDKAIKELETSIADAESKIKIGEEGKRVMLKSYGNRSRFSRREDVHWNQLEQSIKRAQESLTKDRAALAKLQEPPSPAEQKPPPPADVGPGMVGMGGATPQEFEQPGTYVSNMFAAIDRDRAEMGKPPMEATKRRTWDEDNQRALAQMNRNPNWIPDLIREVLKRPRPLLSWENAGLVWQREFWKTEYNNSLKRIAQAFEDGRQEDLASAKTEAAVFEDKLEELDQAVGRGGTGSEAGRTLQAQKMGAGDDFTLVEMTLQKRAALGGRRLTPEETAAIQKDVERLNALNAELQKELAGKDQKLAQAEAERSMAELKAKGPTFDRRVLAAAESIVKKMETSADAAMQRIRAKMAAPGALAGPIDPTLIDDFAIVASAKIARLGLDLAKLTDDFVRDFGEAVKEHMPAIWQRANELVDAATTNVSAPVKRLVKKVDLAETKKAVVEKVKEKVAEKKPHEITFYVRKLARELYQSGITDREAMVDALYDTIKEADPTLTRRQVMDMFSGYGDYKRLSKNAITVALRGMKGELQQMAKLEDMAASKPPLKSGVERRTPTDVERQLIKLVNDAKNKFQIPVTDPETQLKSALDTLKTTLANRIKDYEDRLARKDFASRPRREIVLDSKANQLKVEADRIKKRFREALIADRLKNRNKWEKLLDWGTKIRRFDILSSPVVIPKLLSAGVQRLSSLPVEEAIGTAIGHVPGYRMVFGKAPLEGGGLNLMAEMVGFKGAFMKGLKDAYDVLKTGHSDLDVLYGKAGESYTGEFELMSRLLAMPGRVHGMIKAPVKRATFERAVERMGKYYADQGIPIDDVLKTRIALDAYKAANRSIFLNDNRIASAFTAALRTAEQPLKETGHATAGGKALATLGRVTVPIVRVPLNIVAETMQYATGLVTGNVRLANAFRRGIETLTPEQADLIARELKKGSIGAAVLIMGYANADAIGGYYQPGKKPGTQKWGTIRVFGHEIPSYLLHNPLLETLQLGATVRHVADSKLRKKDRTTQGLTEGVLAGAFGVVEQVPFMREMVEIEKLRNPYTRDRFFGEQAKSLVVPAAVSKTAEWLDPLNPALQRRPRTTMEYIKSGIPVLREQLPYQLKK